ncbi:MAG: Gfo/Idh/MocA family oxidoreductase [Planctomycetes bacterium]|jgi:predicted dehydrogenase|nr:Gfo/Idh/MocA family oxidoreductase [Planctomycetota bacterium]
MNKVRIGLVGAGKIAQVCCAKILEHPSAAVTAVHDVNAQRMEQLRQAHQIPNACATVEAMLARDDVDAVYIAVPNKFHKPLAVKALNAGKHVLLDKPFAMNLAEAQEIARAAREARKILMLGMNQRYCPDSQKIRSIVADGGLGEIYHAKAFWMRREGIPRLGTWFCNRSTAGGGCMLDIGVHVLDLCLFLMDNWSPVSVFGCTYSKFGSRGLGEGGWGLSECENIPFDVDDLTTATVRFANGASVSIDASWAAHMDVHNKNDVLLFGTQAGAGTYPARLFRRDPHREGYSVIEDVNAKIAMKHADRFHNFVNVILGIEEPLVTVEQALVVQKIIDGIYESCRTGKSVDLS